MVQRAAMVVFLALFLVGMESEVFSGDKGDAEKKAVEKVFKQLEGSWQRTGFVQDGKDRPLADNEKVVFTFKNGKGQLKLGDKVVAEGEFLIDPSKTPTAVDLKTKEGGGKVMIGIMEIKGDMLTFCWSRSQDRPTEFTAEKGSKQMLEKFKRVTP